MLVLGIVATNASADGRPNRFVDKDKVWHYNIANYLGGRVVSEEKGPSIRFQKDDIRMGDKDYSVLIQMNSQEEVSDTIALLRQEGDRLYLFNDKRFNEFLIADNKENNPEYLNKEILVYDFDAKPGDSYMGVACGDTQLNEITQILVDSVETIEVNCLSLRKQILRNPEDYDPSDYVIAVEGFGVTGPKSFFLPYLGGRLCGGYLAPHSEFKLRCVTDTDGNVIFTERDFGTRDYEPMLVEGRVMENYFYSRSGYEPDSYIRSVFDGTVEKFGKTYHRLRPEGSESEGTLFREENGKVWRLANESGKIIFTPEAKEAEPFEADREFLVYDMGMSPGDTLTLYSSFRDAFSGPDYEGVMWGRTMRLDSVGTVVIGGKDRIVQFWSSNRHEPVPGTFKNGLQVVEGLGNMCGTFEFSCVRPFYAGDTDVFDLNRVIESDGTITYEQYEPVPMIREGQVWEYHLSGGKADVGNVERLLRFGFKGTVERNGTEYHRLIDLDTEETVALMREEYRQVHILLPEDKDSGEKEREALLYDFGYRMLAGVESVAFRGHDWDNPFGNPYMHVQSASHLYGTSSDNGTRIRWVFVHYGPEAPYSAIEGIGSIWGGTLFAPVADKTEYTDSAPRIVFNNLYDSEGNVLCPGADKKVAGVETVSGDDRANDSRKYDLNGREMRNPEPGTVYIQGGRKHVAPRR